MKFIEAEATFATNKQQSYEAYLAGIAAHMDKLGVPAMEKMLTWQIPLLHPA
jgi:hypothetical protein